jgi:hypothetical protein
MKTIKGKAERPFTKKRGLLCTECGSVLCSWDRHDFRSCNCGPDKGIFIDGGNDYFRCGGRGIETRKYKEVEVKIFEKEGKEDADTDIKLKKNKFKQGTVYVIECPLFEKACKKKVFKGQK